MRDEGSNVLVYSDRFTDRMHAQAPYVAKGKRTLRNDGDGIFRQGGERLLLAPAPVEGGYAARFDLALQIA